VKAWLRWTPGLESLARYRRKWLLPDLLAGVVLAAGIVPVGMAYAELAGLAPIYGLYASLAALLVYAVFGPSRAIVMGPDSATASLVAAAIIPLALADPAMRVAYAGTLALLVGVISLVVGIARLGFVTDLLSKPVRIGYMNGIALAIIVSQLPKLLGFSAQGEGVFGLLGSFFRGIEATNVAALALGAASVVLILVLSWIAPRAPGALIAVAGATVVSSVLGLAAKGVVTVGMLPQGLPEFRIPALSGDTLLPLLAGAVGIAVITLTDTTVLTRSFAAKFGYESDADKEFIALGTANVAAGFFQGFPVSGSQTRSAINVSAGAKSQAAGLVAAVTLGALLVAAPGLLENLPLSVLAAVIICAGIDLADARGTIRLWYWRRTEFVLSLATFLGVIVLGVLPGVFFAVVLSMLNFVRRQWWPHDAVLGRVPGVKGYHDIGDFNDAIQVPGLLLFRFDAPLFFANANIFKRRLIARIDAASVPVRRVVICAEPLIDVDTTAADTLIELVRELRAGDIEIAFAELKHPVREHLEKCGVIDLVGAEMLFPTIGTAVHAYVSAAGVQWVDWEDTS